jgi:hypothetical protein
MTDTPERTQRFAASPNILRFHAWNTKQEMPSTFFTGFFDTEVSGEWGTLKGPFYLASRPSSGTEGKAIITIVTEEGWVDILEENIDLYGPDVLSLIDHVCEHMVVLHRELME